MSGSLKIFLFASALVLILSDGADARGGCRNVFCRGGAFDKCFECGSFCPPTCENPRPQNCPQVCLMNTCQCAGGTVRGPNGRCIWPSQCPRRPKCKK